MPDWLRWARRLQAISQAGLLYSTDPADPNPHDEERYRQIQDIAEDMLVSAGRLELKQVEALFAGEVGHPTPKVDVRGVVFAGEKILLVREHADRGRWTVPGGWAEIGEPPAAGAEREVREESGYEVKATKLLACYDRDLHHPPGLSTYKLFFLCDLIGGSPTESHETSGASFFDCDDLPKLSLARVTGDQIRGFFEHSRNPELPTDFD